MGRSSSHRITVCTSCRHGQDCCRPGYALIENLRAAIAAAGDTITEEFEISGVARMVGCLRPCTVAYHGTRNAAYLFGDVDPDSDVGDLVTFAHQYVRMDDGWRSSLDYPGSLSHNSLTQVPAALIVMDENAELMQ